MQTVESLPFKSLKRFARMRFAKRLVPMSPVFWGIECNTLGRLNSEGVRVRPIFPSLPRQGEHNIRILRWTARSFPPSSQIQTVPRRHAKRHIFAPAHFVHRRNAV